MSAASNRHIRMAYLGASYLVLVITLTRTLVAPRDVLNDYLLGTTLAVLVTMTCVYDAAVRGRPWAFGARFPFLVVWPVATPLYVIRSRGWWGLVVLLIHFAVLFAIVFALAIVAVVTGLVGR